MSEKILRGTLKRFESLMETRYSFCVVLVFCLAAYNFFYHLGAGPVYDWDEARNGVNTYEMLQNHDFCAGTFNHQLDHWNLKPPLGDWCILLGYRLFGFSIMGLRFYSAFSCLLMVIILLAVLPGIFGKIPTLLAGFVLTMTPLFIYAHGARTGDFCSLFCLFYRVLTPAFRKSSWITALIELSEAFSFQAISLFASPSSMPLSTSLWRALRGRACSTRSV